MNSSLRTRIPIVFLIIATCLIGTVSAASLGIDWRQSPVLAENVFSGVTITPDASTIYSGGSQLLVRSWDDKSHWGGQAGFIAAMSADGNYVVGSTGSTITLYNKSGQQLWSRNMDGLIKAVAVSPNATYVISADDKGNYNSWSWNGEFYGRNKSDAAKRVAISPGADLIVVTSEAGIRYYTPSLQPVWTDSREGSLDDYIVISSDGSTIITAGGSRISSHSRTGALNWQNDAGSAINDIACSEDCSLIVVGSQDNTVRGIDRYGKTHWTYKLDQWANAVATSRNGGIVAAGSNDGTVAILDHNGNLMTSKKFDSKIQPRTLAVSRDGTRIAVADRYYLYGLYLSGTSASEKGDDTVFIAAPLNPVTTITTVTTPSPTAPPVYVTMPEEARPTQTTAAQKSPAGFGIILTAIAGAFCLAGWSRR
jgi:WD40 repeat protein